MKNSIFLGAIALAAGVINSEVLESLGNLAQYLQRRLSSR